MERIDTGTDELLCDLSDSVATVTLNRLDGWRVEQGELILVP